MRLDRIAGALATLATGIAVGLLAERLPGPSLFRSGVALVVAWLLSGVGAAALRLLRVRGRTGIAAVSFGLAEATLSFLLLLTAGLAIYLLQGLLGAIIHPGLTGWRTLLLGIIGALAGAGAATSGAAHRGAADE